MNKVEWKRLEGKNQKSKFQVTFQLQLENHHFESELKSDLKIQNIDFCNFPSIASIQARNDVWSVESMDWKGKIKSQNFKSLFSFNLKIIILSQN